MEHRGNKEESVEWPRWARSTTTPRLPTSHNHQYVLEPQTNYTQYQNPPQCPVPYTQGTFHIIFAGYYLSHNTPCATCGRAFVDISYTSIEYPVVRLQCGSLLQAVELSIRLLYQQRTYLRFHDETCRKMYEARGQLCVIPGAYQETGC